MPRFVIAVVDIRLQSLRKLAQAGLPSLAQMAHDEMVGIERIAQQAQPFQFQYPCHFFGQNVFTQGQHLHRLRIRFKTPLIAHKPIFHIVLLPIAQLRQGIQILRRQIVVYVDALAHTAALKLLGFGMAVDVLIVGIHLGIEGMLALFGLRNIVVIASGIGV